jgi:tetratricopeptide (TPR) repeat protein
MGVISEDVRDRTHGRGAAAVIRRGIRAEPTDMNRSRGAVGAVLLCLVLSACGGAAPSSLSPAGATGPAAPPPATAAATALPLPSPSVPESPTIAEIVKIRARLGANPDDAASLRDLGLALLQRVRETADPSLYTQAGEAFDRARRLDPDDPLVLVGIGGLQLARHEFGDALETAQAVLVELPELPEARAIQIDALVELGRYGEAAAAIDDLVALHPDIVSLPRLSYLRELHGDIPGAVEAMRAAAESPGLAPENTTYVLSLLATLLLHDGDPEAARRTYHQALAIVPDHAPSLAGLGRLAVGRGELDEAIERFGRASAILPLPEYVIALGEAQDAAGNARAAGNSYALARAEIQLFEAVGTQVDLDLALFEADHGDAGRALELANAAYTRAPTVRAADALGWALHRLGRHGEAQRRADEAIRLGSRDPLLRFHRGAILAALGEDAEARRDLVLALEIDPGFSATGGAEARRLLDGLGG